MLFAQRWPNGRVGPVLAPTLVALALALAACGTGRATPTESRTPEASPSVAAEPSPSATPSEAPTLGPTLTPTPTPAPTTVPTLGPPPSIHLVPIATGLTHSIGVSSPPADPRLFVIEQSGQIVIVAGGKVTGTFMNIAGRISCCSERGLLGLAFHPRYATNGRFFVRYTDPAGDLRVSEFRVTSNPSVADPASERILLTIPHPAYANHDGGRIEFGPDGYLYIGTGDGGSGGDPHGHGQSLGTRLGKMLRIDVDHTTGSLPYAIPLTNPFVGQAGALGEIWSYGLRNPYSFSFDRETGDLWIGDVGQDRWEEVDRATAASGGGRGLDFGWNVMEGAHCYNPSSGCAETGLTLPIAEYGHGSNDSIGCAIIGGYVYRGTGHPDLNGRYFFGDNCSGRIWALDAAGPTPQKPESLLSSGVNISGWGQDSTGELYVVGLNGTLYGLA